MKKLIAFVGPSGCGKSYIEKELINEEFDLFKFIKLKQVTTRKRRKNESEDTYDFINIEEYKKIEDRLIGKTEIEIDGIKNYYGTIPVLEFDFPYIYTIIVNLKGLKDLINFVKYESKEKIELLVIMIDSSKPKVREERNEEFVSNERKELMDSGLVDLYLINHPEDNEYINTDTIIRALLEMNFLTIER